MTISEQESMLFGGWAKVQTPLQIEIGVFKPSGTASLSILKQKATLQLRLYRSDPSQPIIYERVIEHDEDGKSYFRDCSLDEIDDTARKMTAVFLLEQFKHLAFVRYVEIWSESLGMDVDHFKRAISGTEKAVKSFAGILGSQNGKTLQKSGQKWELVSMEKLYPEIRKLSVEIIENVRVKVRERKKKNA